MRELAREHRRAAGSQVFTKKNGKPWKDYRNRWRKTRTAAKLPDYVRFYDLRHTAGTYLMLAGVHPFIVQDILGHSSFEMTKRYSHVTEDAKREAVSTLRWDKVVQLEVKREKRAEGGGDVSADE